MGIGVWGQQMWLSNGDFLDGVQAAIDVQNVPFAVLNLVSNNAGMRWDLAETRRVLGFHPKDGHASVASLEDIAEDNAARTPASFPANGWTSDFSRCAVEFRMNIPHFHIAAEGRQQAELNKVHAHRK